MENKKRVIITGSSSGIGLSIASALAKNSFRVFLTGRNEQRLQKTKI